MRDVSLRSVEGPHHVSVQVARSSRAGRSACAWSMRTLHASIRSASLNRGPRVLGARGASGALVLDGQRRRRSTSAPFTSRSRRTAAGRDRLVPLSGSGRSRRPGSFTLDRKILTTATPAATAARRSSETVMARLAGRRETLDVGERVGPGGAWSISVRRRGTRGFGRGMPVAWRAQVVNPVLRPLSAHPSVGGTASAGQSRERQDPGGEVRTRFPFGSCFQPDTPSRAVMMDARGAIAALANVLQHTFLIQGVDAGSRPPVPIAWDGRKRR